MNSTVLNMEMMRSFLEVFPIVSNVTMIYVYMFLNFILDFLSLILQYPWKVLIHGILSISYNFKCVC